MKRKKIHTYRVFKSEIEKSKYINLLDIELDVINSMNIDTRAKELYKFKYDNPDYPVSKRCIDFKDMERLALQYIKQEDTN